MVLHKYLINENELLSFLKYEILYKWEYAKKQNEDNNDFANFLINSTPYNPNSNFIQSLCQTKAEHEDPIGTGVYKDILPADVASYQLRTLYQPYNKEDK